VKLCTGKLNLSLEQPPPASGACWNEANTDAKKLSHASKLNDLSLIECTSCQNLMCQSASHRTGIENYTLNVLKSVKKLDINVCLWLIKTVILRSLSFPSGTTIISHMLMIQSSGINSG